MPRFTPEELYNNYRKGFSGCLWEQHVFDNLMENSKYPLFGDATGKRFSNSGKGKLSTPYKSDLKFDNKAYEERQTTGDCVSHGTRNACDLSRAVEIDVEGEREAWIARGATEAIYGARGHSGQGMSCARAAEFVSKNGGIGLLFGGFLDHIALFWGYVGVGISVYGVVYFILHDVLVHSRWGSIPKPLSRYLLALRKAHRMHHKHTTAQPGESYGLLIFHPRYFSETKRDQAADRNQ